MMCLLPTYKIPFCYYWSLSLPSTFLDKYVAQGRDKKLRNSPNEPCNTARGKPYLEQVRPRNQNNTSLSIKLIDKCHLFPKYTPSEYDVYIQQSSFQLLWHSPTKGTQSDSSSPRRTSQIIRETAIKRISNNVLAE